ncbi:MAG: hypothetical protein ABH827_03595 [bacterium]
MFIFKNITKVLFILLGLLFLQQAQATQKVTVDFINNTQFKLTGESKKTLLPSCNLQAKQTISNLCDQIQKLKKSDPQIIIWYSGQEGLSQRCSDFYKENLFKPIQKNYKQDQFCIYPYDLSAWKGLSKTNISLTKTYCNRESDINITPVFSCDFFKYLEKAQDTELETLQEILKQEFIWQKSTKSPKNTITLRDLQEPYSPKSLQDLQDIDTAKIYSALQYLEGLWLTKTILKKNLNFADRSQESDDTPEINIIFLLPNDELEYYQSKLENTISFKYDLNKLISSDTELKNQDFNLTISFQNFSYAYRYTKSTTTNNPFSLRPYVLYSGEKIIVTPKQNLDLL